MLLAVAVASVVASAVRIHWMMKKKLKQVKE